ncbi:MAG: FHA domain-containing protein [Coleofasciculaceae cyanobacterium]
MKIKAFNHQTGSFQEKVLTPKAENFNHCLVGRHPSCDLVLNAPEISRVHALIDYRTGHYYFTDLASTDGSRLNNCEIPVNQSCLLKPDDVIRIGDFVLLLEEMESVEEDSKYLFASEQAITATLVQPRTWSVGDLTVCCSQVIEETPDVKTFRFVASPPLLFSYKPGQFVTLDLEIEGKRVKRSYSISSTPSRPHNLEITVKRVPSPGEEPDVPPGLVSNWLNGNLTVGDQVKLSGPLGNFTCVDNSSSSKLLLISAGSGITPMMSMARWLFDTAVESSDVVFIHSARTVQDIIFRQELELMTSRHPRFKFAVTLTRHEPGQAWLGYTGRLNEAMLQAIAPDYQERTVYVCGSDPFRESVKTVLQALKYPMQNYHEESFGGSRQGKKSKKQKSFTTTNTSTSSQTGLLPVASPTSALITSQAKVSPTSTASHTVVFAQSEKEVVCDDEETILEVAQRVGIELPYGCQMGVCGRCKLRQLEGQVDYEEETECEEGYVLTCVARPAKRVVVEA